MANKIFRSLISTVLVICLMHFQTSIALAETKGVTEEKGVVKTSSDGKKSQSVAYNFSDVDESSMMATLTMIAIGIFGITVLRNYDNLTMDMKAVLAGSAAYVGGEVYSNISLKGKLDKIKIEFEKKSGESMQNQLEAFTDLKTGYTEAKKTIETKNMLQTAAATAFGVAAGIAAYDAIKMHMKFRALDASLKVDFERCNAIVGTTLDPITKALALDCIAKLTATKTQLVNLEAISLKPGASAQTKAALLSEIDLILVQLQTNPNIVSTKISAIDLKTEMAMKTAAGDIAIFVGNNQKNKLEYHFQLKGYFVYELIDLIFPKAYAASWTSIIGFLGAGAATYLALTKKELSLKMDTWMATPKLRVVAWGILTGLTTASLSANKKVIKDLDERIKKIDDIIASLTNVENGAKIADSSNSKVNKTNLLKGLGSNTILANAGSSNFKMDCVTSDASTNCPSLAKAITESPEFQELPITLQNLSQKTGNLGDALQGQSNLSDSALASAGELGAQNNAIQNALKDSITKTKKLDNASDLDKAMDDAKNNLLATSKNAADKAGGARGLYASLGGILSNSAGNLNQAKNIAKESQFAPTDSKAGTVAGVKAKAKNNDFEFKLMNENKEVAGTDSPVNVDNDQLASEISKESIGSSNGPSIFEILSHRYYVSGYPKLLEEE